MTKRRTLWRKIAIISCAAVVSAFALLIAVFTVFDREIFEYLATPLCSPPPPEPDPTYVACGDVPATAPTLTDATPSSSG